MENVRRRRVVDDDCVFQVAADLRQILIVLVWAWVWIGLTTYLDVVTLVVVATFAEETVVYNTVNVQLVQQWVAILGQLAYVAKHSNCYIP